MRIVHVDGTGCLEESVAFGSPTQRGMAAFLSQVVGFCFDQLCRQPLSIQMMPQHFS